MIRMVGVIVVVVVVAWAEAHALRGSPIARAESHALHGSPIAWAEAHALHGSPIARAGAHALRVTALPATRLRATGLQARAQGTGNAQTGRANLEPGTEGVEVEPVTCWWRTSATAVRVGETFDVVLTCALLQTEAARVIADESRLEPAVVQLPPFEVLGGMRAKDVVTAARRFVQFEYRLRVIAENVFAAEAALQPLEITYRVESRVAGGDSLAGRDLTYALPRLTMRVLSLVPDTADDIREAPVATFGAIEAAGSRATMFRAAAGVALALGVLMLALALVGALRRRRASRPSADRALTGAVIVNSVRRELAEVRDRVRAAGWTPDLAGRALAAARIVAAYATGRPVTQRPPSNQAEGELLVNSRMRSPAVVSSAVATVDDEELRDALARFAAARYGRDAAGHGSGLDEALDAVIRRADQVAAERPFQERLWAR